MTASLGRKDNWNSTPLSWEQEMASGLYIKLHTRFLTHRKAVSVGPFGRLLYISALGYCVESLSDGFIPENVIARLADVDDPDVTQSVTLLLTRGLLRRVNGGYEIHDYLEWQNSSENVRKKRESGRERQAKYREKQKDVTLLLTRNQDVLVTRAEPEPEPIRKKTIQKKSVKFIPPSLEDVREYCLERKNSIDPQQFIDHYTAKGWKIGKAAVRDWQACVRTWERNEFARKQEAQPNPNPAVAASKRNREYIDKLFEGRE